MQILEFLSSGCILSSRMFEKSEVGKNQDLLWIGWGHPERMSRPPSQSFSIYAPDFFLEDQHPWWVFPNSLCVSRFDLIQALKNLVENPRSTGQMPPMTWIEPDYLLFQSVFADLQSQFHEGRLRKAVPVVFEKARFQFNVEHRARSFLNLLKNTHNVPVYPYGVWNREEGILGASPEILLSRGSEGLFYTAALAGTRLRESSHLPLLEDPKEIEEHQIVVDDICSSLSEFGRVSCSPTQELVLPTLSHLLTPIQLALDADLMELDPGQVFERMVTRLHPTPALGAFPRKEGMAWIRSFQNRLDRMKLGAPFGAIGKMGESGCLVSIRNIQWKDSTVYLGAGCGVISASQLDREWREVLGKIQSIKKIFGLEAS